MHSMLIQIIQYHIQCCQLPTPINTFECTFLSIYEVTMTLYLTYNSIHLRY